MSGTVVGRVLSLRGTAIGEGFTAVVPGVAAIRSTLSDVARQPRTARMTGLKAIRSMR